MNGSQLPLFQRKKYKGIIPSIPVEVRAPTGDMTVLETVPAYYSYLKDGGFSKYTPDDFTGDVKKFGVYLKDKPLKDIKDQDIQGWISFLKTPGPKGEGLSAKPVSRKLTALGNYFSWLMVSGVIVEKANPMRDIANSRITSPLPEILFEEECSRLLTAASADPRTYLLFSSTGTGIKLEELFTLRISHFDFSNKYSSENANVTGTVIRWHILRHILIMKEGLLKTSVNGGPYSFAERWSLFVTPCNIISSEILPINIAYLMILGRIALSAYPSLYFIYLCV